LEKPPTTTPPIIPAIKPATGGAPLAIAIPKQSGSATKKTTKLDLKSLERWLPILFSIKSLSERITYYKILFCTS
jgi:hypothetical protein